MTVRKPARRDQSSFGAIDYLLMAAGNCFAAYSAGMAVGEKDVAWFFVYAITGGTIFSLLIRKFFGQTRFVKIDSFLYAGATFAAVGLTAQLNPYLPGDGIPADVITAGWLCWMLSFGSALTWRDRTLLFQAVPTIALFGLVGCYDTYKGAPFMFFGFLLCLATLLGRSHSREMLRQAVESGYFNRADAPNTPTEYPEQSPELYEDIKKGPWRWLAGPEWALMSGLAIVFVSLLGAPVIQQVVQPLSGVIHVATPKSRLRQNAQMPTAPITSSSYEVGRGPLFDPHSKPVPLFVCQLDRIRYLRTASYDIYDGHGWRSSYPGNASETRNGPTGTAILEMKDSHTYHITVRPETTSQVLPLPAEVLDAAGVFDATGAKSPLTEILLREDGGGEAVELRPSPVDIDGIESNATPVEAQRDLPAIMQPDLQTGGIVASVKAFADQAVKGSKTDYDKASAIARAVADRCDYSLSAPAVPTDRDAADFFLNTSRLGYCDLFATAMVLSARAEAIPARYVLGYLPDAANRDNAGNTVVQDHDYHAWAELYFKNVGWVVFDATAGANSRDDKAAAEVKSWWSGSLTTVLNVLILGVAAVFGGIWLWPRLKRSAPKRTIRTEIEKEYLTFTKAMSRLSKRRRRPSETPDEYLTAVRPFLAATAEAAERLNAKFVLALYAPSVAVEGYVTELRSEVRSFVKLSRKRANQ